MKVYYNITKIENGWLLNHPIKNEAEVGVMRWYVTDSYHENLRSVLEFIGKHYEKSHFDK